MIRIFLLGLLLPFGVAAQVLINEVKVNPPGADEKYEFIEIRSYPNTTLNNIYVCVFEGDSSNPGVLDRVFRVMNTTLGSSGLMLFATSLGYPNVPSDCVFKDTLVFGITGGIIENGTNTYATFFSTIPFVEGSDYDIDNDGQLELPTGAVMMDAVGWTNGNPSAIVYGGAVLSQAVGTPDAAVRFYSNSTAFSSSAWYCGDLLGGASSLDFDTLETSANFPSSGAVLTPGSHNQPLWASLSEHDKLFSILAFPNPSAGLFQLRLFESSIGGLEYLEVFDAQGKRCLSQSLQYRSGEFLELDLSGLPDGLYHLNYFADKTCRKVKLLKFSSH